MSEIKVIHEVTDSAGRQFKIIGDLDALMEEVAKFELDEEFYDPHGDGRPPTEDELFNDIMKFSAYLNEDDDWQAVVDALPKKKNGTFHKGRVHRLARADSLRQYWEDSYGYNAPELRVKTISDTEAEISIDHITEHW